MTLIPRPSHRRQFWNRRNTWLCAIAVSAVSVATGFASAGEVLTAVPQVQRAVTAADGKAVADGDFLVLPGFQVEKLFTVPKETLGSWVAIAFDHKGRLLASDQGDKGLCRVTIPAPGSDEQVRVERLDLKITAAQGILAAFDSLYLSVNGGPGSGLYRARDTDGDDQYDELAKLKDFRGGGEHGPHALQLAPDGKSIYVVCGNHTRPPFDPEKPGPGDSSRNPLNWGEDLLLPRQWDANGHARGILAPGGWIAKTDPNGKTWEIVSNGYRNAYDMAFNAEGELFAYDSDMEWDMGSPWYRPTRVTHATSGSEFGWRSGTGKWPAYYVDSLPPLLDVGPGSPVGVAFGYGARFPARYQRALYLCDWTFGTMYAVHLEPEGASYRATKEEFLSRTPLPLTDVAIGPDGGMLFTIGGRGTQSELFRVTYVGTDSVAPVAANQTSQLDLRRLRREIEKHHRRTGDPDKSVAFIYPHLRHADRHIRYAARVALEHQPVETWQDLVLAEPQPQALITGVVALARQGGAALKPQLLRALEQLEFESLALPEQLDLLRAYQLVFIRMGEPDDQLRTRLAKRLDGYFPSPQGDLNRELSTLLVYLRSPNIISKILTLLEQPATRDAADLSAPLDRNERYGGAIASMLANHPDLMQIHYAFVLRNLKEGWTLDQRKRYFAWFDRARTWSGGASFQGFLRNIDREAFENATEKERLAMESFGARKPYQTTALPTPKGPGRNWTVADLLEIAGPGLKKRNFENGQKMYAAARCVVCHRFGGEGGATGPDLTQLAGRFNLKDLSEAMLEPSKVISDQYRASTVQTSDGNVYTGRIVTETADEVTMLTHPEDPTKVVTLKKRDVDEMQPSALSLMPKDLLQQLNQDEVLDLLAYLLSRGEKNHPMFRR